MAVVVLPLMSVSERMCKDIAAFVRRELGDEASTEDSLISFPDGIYNKDRKQYDAAEIITFLKPYAEPMDAKIVALCNFDIFVKGKDFVYGAALGKGNICVVSLYRLDPRFYGKASSYEAILERAEKEVLHELGHCFGLAHCPDEKCAMCFSGDIASVDIKNPSFCKECKEELKEL